MTRKTVDCQLKQLEGRVMERLLGRLSPGSREETLPTTETEGELGAVCGSWVPGSLDSGWWYQRATCEPVYPAIGHIAGMSRLR